MMFKFRLVALLIFVFCADAFSEVMPFGRSNQLIVDARTGLYNLKYAGKLVVQNASAAFALGDARYETKNYSKHTLRVSKLNDKLGAGRLLTLTSTQNTLPNLIQRFYCYAGKDFVITEVEIVGRDLSSNYIAPLVSTQANIYAGNKLQTLFVPYDNDTFIRYQAKALNDDTNISAEVGLVYDNASRKGLIVGSLTHDDWKSGVVTKTAGSGFVKLEAFGGLSDVAITRDSMAHGSLKGDKIRSPKIFIGYFNDWRNGLETYAKAGNALEGRYIKPWTKATPVGWNSWGVIAEKLNYEKATGVVDYFEKALPQFRNEDGTAYMDLDSFWDNMVRGGFRGDFSKLKEFVAYCKARKLEPGVYWAPFTDWGFRSKDLNRTAEGGDYKYTDMWIKTAKGYHDLDGGRALDPTHPGTQKRIAFVLGKLKDCGFKMIKIDFLGHGAAEATGFYDPKVTTGMQAYKVGMQAIDDALDNSMLVYAAISPSLATAKYTHMRRIACDSWKSIKDTEYTLNSVTYGWWQTYLYDYVDADHVVFEKERPGANRARLISALIAGPIILGDDYSKPADWQPQVQQWLQRPEIKPVFQSGKVFMPVDGATRGAAAQAFIKRDGNVIYLAVLNYKKGINTVYLDSKRLDISETKAYQLKELLGGDSVSSEMWRGRSRFKIRFTEEGGFIYKLK